MNTVLRVLLRTPLGALVRPFALLEFEARRSGRRLRVPVGWYELETGPVVITPAPWRPSFRGGRTATVWFHGRRRDLVGTLEENPAHVAEVLRAIQSQRGSLQLVGIAVPDEHEITAADVSAVERAVIHFAPAST